MNKKQILLLAIIYFSYTMNGCVKSDANTANNCIANNTGVPTAAEVASLQAHITTNGLIAMQHPDGFFYKIVAQGTGATPTLASNVTVKYTGKLTNGNVFDQNITGTTFLLSQLILGWRRGLPLIQKGGSIILYLPPSLGYGCSSVGIIPPDSNLIFSIDLLDVQ